MAPFFGGLLRRTRFDYRKEVGDCLDASVVMAPVQWMQRALPEATLMVQRTNRKGEIDELPDHLMLALIQNPHPHYGDIVLWWGSVLRMALDGNASWTTLRKGLGRPAELSSIPPLLTEPNWPA